MLTILLIYMVEFTIKLLFVHKQHMVLNHVAKNVLRKPVPSGPLESYIKKEGICGKYLPRIKLFCSGFYFIFHMCSAANIFSGLFLLINIIYLIKFSPKFTASVYNYKVETPIQFEIELMCFL